MNKIDRYGAKARNGEYKNIYFPFDKMKFKKMFKNIVYFKDCNDKNKV